MNESRHIGKVLIVDDDPACLATLDLALQAATEFFVVAVASAGRAVELLQSQPEDVCAVITDLQLPGMTGIEMITWIRAQPQFRLLPVVVISATPDPAAPARALSAGASHYFPKPFSPGILRNRLRELVQQYLQRSNGDAENA